MIGLEWEKVHREADRWEHAISADVEEKLVVLLGDPMTCPHGNPIPGYEAQGATRSPSCALAEAEPGPVTVARISEKLELDDDGLHLVATARLIPGATATVVGQRRRRRAASKTPAGEHTVPMHVAEQMFVTRLRRRVSRPATAGTMLTRPSATGVSRPSRKRMSSSATNTLTKRRSSPVSSKRRSPKPGCAASSAFSTSATVAALDRDLGRAAGERAQLRGDADGDGHRAVRSSGRVDGRTRRGTRRASGRSSRSARRVGATASSVFRPWPVM